MYYWKNIYLLSVWWIQFDNTVRSVSLEHDQSCKDRTYFQLTKGILRLNIVGKLYIVNKIGKYVVIMDNTLLLFSVILFHLFVRDAALSLSGIFVWRALRQYFQLSLSRGDVCLYRWHSVWEMATTTPSWFRHKFWGTMVKMPTCPSSSSSDCTITL